MTTVLLWCARIDPLGDDPKLDQRHGYTTETCRGDRREWTAIVRSKHLGQPELTKSAHKDRPCIGPGCIGKPVATKQISTIVVRNRQRIAKRTVCRAELAFEVHAPYVIRASCLRQLAQARWPGPAIDLLDEPGRVQDTTECAYSRPVYRRIHDL